MAQTKSSMLKRPSSHSELTQTKLGSSYTKYDSFVITAFGIFKEGPLSKETYDSICGKVQTIKREEAYNQAIKNLHLKINSTFPKVEGKTARAMAEVVLDLANKYNSVH